jgi:hypothetical protein
MGLTGGACYNRPCNQDQSRSNMEFLLIFGVLWLLGWYLIIRGGLKILAGLWGFLTSGGPNSRTRPQHGPAMGTAVEPAPSGETPATPAAPVTKAQAPAPAPYASAGWPGAEGLVIVGGSEEENRRFMPRALAIVAFLRWCVDPSTELANLEGPDDATGGLARDALMCWSIHVRAVETTQGEAAGVAIYESNTDLALDLIRADGWATALFLRPDISFFVARAWQAAGMSPTLLQELSMDDDDDIRTGFVVGAAALVRAMGTRGPEVLGAYALLAASMRP